MNNDVYYEYNPWWEDKDFLPRNLIERPNILTQMEKFFQSRSIVFLTGLRRVGKTSLMKLFISGLIKKGIDPVHIFYVSLDDYALNDKSIIDIISDYRKIHKLPVQEKIYVFLDEVSHKDKFHQQLKNIYDLQNVKIYATSSSSSVLKDKKAYLTGREFVLEVMPLDFREYLDFKGISIKKRDGKLLESYFDDFLKTGGIPEYVLFGQREYLQSLVEDIVYKDIIAPNKIKNQKIVKEFFKILMANVGNPISTYKISKTLKISSESTSRYLQFFEDTFLIYTMPRYGKTNLQITSPRKVYAPDIGVRNLYTGFINKGRVFENYVYLKTKEWEPFYVYENQIELDFFIDRKVLVEVKYLAEIKDNQKEAFDRFDAEHKFVVKGIEDLERLQDFLKGGDG